jgi:hypothetical protein
MSAFDRLIEQIDLFIRKFYKNQLLKGFLLFGIVFLFTFLLTTSLEFIGRFNSYVRAFFFFGFIGFNLFILVKYFVLPLSKLFSFGKRINNYQASQIIGQFFPNVSDRLLNTLQLNDSLNSQDVNYELISASVSQRANTLTKVSFANAVDFSENKRYVKYILPLVFLFLIILIFIPSIFTQGANRVVHYSSEFKIPAPFTFNVSNSSLYFEEGDDFRLKLNLQGNVIPNQVFLVSSEGKFLMQASDKNSFEYNFLKLHSSVKFHFEANGFESDDLLLKMKSKATIGNVSSIITYPAYLKMKPLQVQNSGDLIIPEGSSVSWSVKTKNAKRIAVNIAEESLTYKSDFFKFDKKLSSSTNLKIKLWNKETNSVDSTISVISVVKDAYPSILIQEEIDSIKSGVRFFNGSIQDDYGFSSLSFVYTIVSGDGAKRSNTLSVAQVFGTEMPFNFAVDFSKESLKLKDVIEYYFLVKDNDGVNGSKSTRSNTYTYELPNLDELLEERNKNQEEAKAGLSDLLNKASDFKKDINSLKKDFLNAKTQDYQKLNKLQQLKEEYQEIQSQLDQLQQNMENSLDEKNSLSEVDQEILEKEQMIQELLDKLMDDELKDLLDQLEELMKTKNKEQIQESLDELEMSSEDMNKQLDRSLEMLKKLEVNERIDDIEKKLKDLADQQKNLEEKISKKEISKEESLKEQDALNKDFDKLKKDLDEMHDLNEALKRPMDIGKQQDQQESISKEMNDAKESLSKDKSGKASDSQKKASDEMNQMAKDLNAMQQEANKKEAEEDINTLRGILENLMTLSFNQEDLISKFAKVQDKDPAYRTYGRKQRAIVDDNKIIRDSLYALAERQPKIASFVDKELNVIQRNFKTVLESIDEHRKRSIGVSQQSVMTSYNNLALLLNEALESMQQQAASQKPGSGSCDNPGGKGQPKPGGMSSGDMKEMLKKQLKEMEKGNSPGGNKPGDKPGNGSMGLPGMSNEQLAKMAAQQGEIRRRLEQLKNELNKDGKGSGNQLDPLIKELEQQEKDLVNKNFSKDLVKRQKDILTRLLESEKAMMERGFDNKRESNEGKTIDFGNQIRFDEYTKQKLIQIELLQSVDPLYHKYYRDKANEYFNRVN